MIIEIGNKKICYDLFDLPALESLREFSKLVYSELQVCVREHISRKLLGRGSPLSPEVIGAALGPMLEEIDLENRLKRLMGYGLVEIHGEYYVITTDGERYIDLANQVRRDGGFID